MYHFDFYQTWIPKDINNSVVYKTSDHKFPQYVLALCLAQNTNLNNNQNAFYANSIHVGKKSRGKILEG